MQTDLTFLVKRRLLRDPFAVLGLVLICGLIMLAILAPIIGSPIAQDLGQRLLPTGSSGHVLGTDHFGRDLAARLAYGARVSLRVGLLASTISLTIGVILGLLAGYFGGWVDTLIMRFTDIMLGFPVLLFLIAISATLDPGLDTALIAIGCVSWPPMARLMRAQVLTIRSREYLVATTALGLNHIRTMIRHILPNCMAPVIVTFTLGISGAIMAEASLSFLGLGVQPPTPSWGAMINEGKDFLRIAPWISLFPGLTIAMTVLGFNLLGESLRDALDVRLKEK